MEFDLYLSDDEDVDLEHYGRRPIRRSLLVCAYMATVFVPMQAYCMLLLLQHRQRIRFRSYLLRESLTPPQLSPWAWLWGSQNDLSLINTCGIDVATFKYLLTRFRPRFEQTWVEMRHIGGRSNRGRRRAILDMDALGLVLHFICSRMHMKTLSQLFGIVPSTVSVYLNIALVALHRVLSRDVSEAGVRYPSPEEMSELASLVNRRHPRVHGVWGCVDGTSMDVLDPVPPHVQNAYYNAWTACCRVSSMLVFAFDGTIRYAYVNAPGESSAASSCTTLFLTHLSAGSWHDSQLCDDLRLWIEDDSHFPNGDFAIIGDKAFVSLRCVHLGFCNLSPCDQCLTSDTPGDFTAFLKMMSSRGFPRAQERKLSIAMLC